MRWMDICQCPNLAIVSEATENLEIGGKNQIRDLKPKNILTSQDSLLKYQSRQPPANKGESEKNWKRSGEFAERERKKKFL